MSGERIKALFLRAVQVEVPQREAFVRGECEPDGDEEVIAEVLSLLRAHETGTTFLESSAMSDAGLAPAFDSSWAVPGAKVGPFTLESVIGSGGMGVVFRARQDSPPRPVALKIMRAPGVGGSLKRFGREAAALGRLQHPCIAQVYASGVDRPSGAPVAYLAMELVQGTALDQYIRDRVATLRERTQLMAQICDAVAHAHQRGVVHRDLKPGNILVDQEGVPKVLDFGIARLLEPDGTGSAAVTAQTQHGEILGTLAYMSPEQFEGDPEKLDVRSDVYALGAILYEVLGQTPAIRTEGMSIAHAALAVSAREPALLGSLNPLLRGDLETIAAKALEKEPHRRYQSAAEMTEDLRRHLRDEPILARPATALYRTTKFVRRHRNVVLLAVGVFAALVAGLVTTMWQAAQTEAQRRIAEEEVQTSSEINAFLGELLLSSEPDKARGRTVTVRMALDDAVKRLERGAITSPRVLASLHGTIGRAYCSMAEMTLGEKHIRHALELRSDVFGTSSRQYLDGIADLGVLLHEVGRNEEASKLCGPALETCRRVLGNDNPTTLRLINAYANALPDGPESQQLYREALETSSRVNGPEDEMTLMLLNNISAAMMYNGQFAQAEKLQRRVLEIRRRTQGDDHPDTLVSMRNLAGSLRGQGRLEEALPLIREMVEVGDRVRGTSHPSQLMARAEYGVCLAMLGKNDEAEQVVRVGIARSRMPDGAPTEATPMLIGMLGEILVQVKRLDEAERCAQQSLEAAIAFHGTSGQEVNRAMSVFVSVYEAMEKWDKVREWNEKLRGSHWYQKKYAIEPGEDPSRPPAAPAGAPAGSK